MSRRVLAVAISLLSVALAAGPASARSIRFHNRVHAQAVTITGTAGSPDDEQRPATEVPPWSVPGLGGSHSYLLSTDYSHLCAGAGNILSPSNPVINCNEPALDHLVVGDDAGGASALGIGDATPWRRNYQGAFSAQVIPAAAGPVIVAINHTENKNEIRPPGGPAYTYQNTVVPGVGASQCSESAQGNQPSGCDNWASYAGFLTASLTRYDAATNYGQRRFVDMGPIAWPSAGYRVSSSLLASNGLRHPYSLLDGGYLYVYYLDCSPTSYGFKVIRSPERDLGAPGTFSAYDPATGAWDAPALPSGVRAANVASYYSTPGPRVAPIIGGDGATFQVARITGYRGRHYLGLESYFDGAHGYHLGLRASSDLVHWSPLSNVPGSFALSWSVSPLAYPIMADGRTGSNTEIDPGRFWLLGTRDGHVYRAAMSVTIAGLTPHRSRGR